MRLYKIQLDKTKLNDPVLKYNKLEDIVAFINFALKSAHMYVPIYMPDMHCSSFNRHTYELIIVCLPHRSYKIFPSLYAVLNHRKAPPPPKPSVNEVYYRNQNFLISFAYKSNASAPAARFH